MPSFDVGKRRAEQNLEPVTVTLDSREWTLPPILTGSMAKALGGLSRIASEPGRAEEVVENSYRALFGDRWEEAMDLISVTEVIDILFEVYNLTPGESPASSGS